MSVQSNQIDRNMEGDWCSLWKIIAPPKAKHLLWRIYHRCLPTRISLRQQYVPCPSTCKLCERGEDDESYVLFGCTSTIQCWNIAGLIYIISPCLRILNDVKSLIHDICSKEDKLVVGRIIVMIWVLWNNRNDWIWNNEKNGVNKLRMQAFHTWQYWFKA